MGKSREGPGGAGRAEVLAVEHKRAVFHLDHTLLTYSLYGCSQDSALSILSVCRVERDDSTAVRKLGFPGQWNSSGNVSSGGESLLLPQEELISQECSCVLISKASVLSLQTVYCHGDSLLLCPMKSLSCRHHDNL